MNEKRVIEKIKETNQAISGLWREARALKGSDLDFYNLKSIQKARGGIFFIGTTTDVLKRKSISNDFIRKPHPELNDRRKQFFSLMRFLATQAGCRNKWAYVDFWLGLKTKGRREFPAAKTLRARAAANKDFVKKAEHLSFDLIKTVISELKPRCIIACGMASFFISGRIKSARQAMISSSGFEKTGFHLWDGQIPIFFCESIENSGSGDMFFERLRWHIKKAIRRG